MSIRASDLTKSFKGHRAVDGLSLAVHPGELFGLIGPDGAGKSTFIKMLVTLILPDAGTATVDGFDVVRQYSEVRKRVGYMPGRFSLYQDLSVEENLSFFASVFGTTVEANYEMISSVYRQLEPFKHRKAGALSGGMKQKLALSCALVHRPSALILDEPTTGVDAVSRIEFWDMLDEVSEAGIPILVSTPYMDEASRCDRVALMQDGRILAVDSPQSLVHGFDAPLFGIRSASRLSIIHALRQFEHTDSVHPFGEMLHYVDRRPHPDPVEIEHFLVDRGFTDARVAVIEPTIEDCFMRAMAQTQ